MTTDNAIAAALAAIEAARQAILRQAGADRTAVRVGLRQLASALECEVEQTRTQVARCYSEPPAPRGFVVTTYPTTEG